MVDDVVDEVVGVVVDCVVDSVVDGVVEALVVLTGHPCKTLGSVEARLPYSCNVTTYALDARTYGSDYGATLVQALGPSGDLGTTSGSGSGSLGWN